MTHPLDLSYNWQTPAIVSSVAAIACAGFVLRSATPGRVPVALLVVLLWLLFLAVVWARTRAYLEVDGSRLTVRRFRNRHTVEGHQVQRVEQYLTANGPSYRLRVRQPDGRVRRVPAPVALLRAGHSTLFTWILAEAPQAELDRGSARTLDQLRVRGLVT